MSQNLPCEDKQRRNLTTKIQSRVIAKVRLVGVGISHLILNYGAACLRILYVDNLYHFYRMFTL